jgi:murein DD-endopeptidase MepM/ murein hydrolase activator NlpD
MKNRSDVVNMLKKICVYFLIIIVVLPYFFVPNMMVIGKTLGDLEAELNATIESLRQNKDDEKLTKEQIAKAQENVKTISGRIDTINNEISVLLSEIDNLNIEISNKDTEIKRIVNFLQVANGEAAYLEYTFGAKDFTDFIYRLAISEQLTTYNNKLIDEFNNLIVEKQSKQDELKTEKQNLANEQQNLKNEIDKLGSHVDELYEDALELEDSIATQKEIIQMYKDKGCKTDEDIKSCGRDALPPDTSFWRPTQGGYISSNYGYRTYWINGGWTSDFHSGVDIASSGGTPIYATANGTVASITRYASCGGNYVYIHHLVNGGYYTSLYMHMRDIYVNVGDTVNKNTVIGTMGGNPYVEYWDSCSTGSHLHFSMFYGRVGIDYYSWGSAYYAQRFDPRVIVNFPPIEGSFSDRLSKY